MAPRLTVIISQSETRDVHRAELEEALVGEMLLADGIDANLVGPISTMRDDSTDRLCIGGFQGSVAVLSWLSTAELAEHWLRLDLGGQVRPFGQAPAQHGVRSVVHFQLLETSTAASVIEQLQKLQADRAVKTVGIMGIAPPASSDEPIETENATDNQTASSTRAAQTVPAQPHASPEQQTDLPMVEGAATRAHQYRQGQDENTEFPELDDLVDDFDSLDL